VHFHINSMYRVTDEKTFDAVSYLVVLYFVRTTFFFFKAFGSVRGHRLVRFSLTVPVQRMFFSRKRDNNS
jgi:hypothetical protein